MSRFDRRLKGAGTNKPGSSAACVPQPIPKRAPLLSSRMFNRSRVNTSGFMNGVKNSSSSVNSSLDDLVENVKANNENEKIGNNTIEMINRRLNRLENANNISARTNKVCESLEKRLSSLEKMYSDNMENMEKYVRNQEDRINLLTADYRKTLETLNTIIRDVNNKIVELDATTVKVDVKEEKLQEVKLEEPPKQQIVEVKTKPVIKEEETNDDVIAEVTEEILSKVENEKQDKDKNISLMIIEKDVSNEN
tara:strand:- start:5613 stop:6365 length:753 start_codon:yes stop_codon:yes gene_type:complete